MGYGIKEGGGRKVINHNFPVSPVVARFMV